MTQGNKEFRQKYGAYYWMVYDG